MPSSNSRNCVLAASASCSIMQAWPMTQASARTQPKHGSPFWNHLILSTALQPYHKNFNKRLVKSPKLYFYDTGLACSLLGIRSAEQVQTHFLKGGLFENLIINEFVKHARNRGEPDFPWFWRDHGGKEIDCLLADNGQLAPIEIKAGKTASGSYFDNIKVWQKLTGMEDGTGYVIYGGDLSLQTSAGSLVSWKKLDPHPRAVKTSSEPV